MNKRLVPRLRFKSFNDNWNKNSFNDSMDNFKYGLSVNSKKYDGHNKYLRITDIDDLSHRFNYSDLTSPNLRSNKNDNYILNNNDIVFARTGNSTGKTYLYNSRDGKVYYAGFLIGTHINNNFDPIFIFNQTLTDEYNNFIKIMSQRSGQPGINSEELSKFNFFSPSLIEQQYIGNFFAKLDRMVELQMKKIIHFEQLKKGYLQKMFPKKGENVPKFRFNGFKDSWNVKLLKELIKKSNLKLSVNPNKHRLLSVKLHFNGVCPTKKYPRVTKKGRKYYYRNSGELIIGKQNFQNGGFGIAKNDVNGLIASSAILSFDFLNGTNSKFLVNSMMRHDWLQRTTIYLNGTGQKEYGINTLKNLKISVPSIKEQKKIGQLFNHFDQFIIEQKNKLTQLKILKKAYLQKLFI